ncbi:hypothetical protein MNBD_GAMMA14-753 [hydrothermal vent metagenome]|uniref:Peptidase S8/S53 domain-containing protein n=1 Tax=hydrothermal vent metagenome TaxID=652676 RepID=A0A3B0YWB7_9ZZZZ
MHSKITVGQSQSMFRNFLLSCLAGTFCLGGINAQAQSHAPQISGGQLIIKLKDNRVLRSAASADSRKATPEPLRLPDGRLLTYVRSMTDGSLVIRLPEGISQKEAETLMAQLEQDSTVATVQVDRRLHPALVPNDTEYIRQWYLSQDTAGIRAPGAWDQSTGSSSIVIAVVDTGLLQHVDLNASRILPGYDFISDIPMANDGDGRDADPADPGDAVLANECGVGDPATDEPSSWHGLSVMGVMVATSNNNSNIAGIDFSARILPVRVLGKCGGFVSDIVEAIRWSAGLSVSGVPDNPNPANVINLSLSGEGACTLQEQAAIDDAVAAGAVVVVAAGNEGKDVVNFSPANCANVVTVGAVARDGSIASYANRGEEVDLVGPGGDGPVFKDNVLTLWNDGTTTPGTDVLAYITGTSFTAAQVSSVAALMLAVNGTLAPATVKDVLCATARDFVDGSCTGNLCGAGILDANAALAGAANPASVAGGPGCNVIADSGGGGGGGGGGCVLVDVKDIDPLLPWLAVMAMIGLRRRNR